MQPLNVMFVRAHRAHFIPQLSSEDLSARTVISRGFVAHASLIEISSGIRIERWNASGVDREERTSNRSI